VIHFAYVIFRYFQTDCLVAWICGEASVNPIPCLIKGTEIIRDFMSLISQYPVEIQRRL